MRRLPSLRPLRRRYQQPQREQGEAAYRKAMASARRHAGQADELWHRWASTCVASASTSGDRAWLAVFEPGRFALAPHSSVTATQADNTYIDCQEWFLRVMEIASHVRREVTAATQEARRSGVFPGVMRDARGEYQGAAVPLEPRAQSGASSNGQAGDRLTVQSAGCASR